MKKIELTDITQEDFETAAAVVSSGIKAYNRKLDTRAGTVLRDLLVDPEAAIESVTSGQIEEARRSSSLKRLKEAQDDGEEIDQEDVLAILSNFNITPSSGTTAKGLVKVVVADGTVAYAVAEGEEFSTVDGKVFLADYGVVAAPDAMTNPSIDKNATLYQGAAGFFFLVPVTARDVGEEGNIRRGTSLEPTSAIMSFVMAEAYKDFDGGSDVQPLGSVIDSIPSGLSIRGFVNKTATEGMLRDRFDSGEFPIVAVSSVGYGNAAQIRDRHNLFGVGVGGRVDVYVRNFADAATHTETLKGHRKPGTEGEYTIEVPAGVFPGAYWIKSVSDPFNKLDADSEDALSSLVFDAKRTADVTGTWHDIDRGAASVEAFDTIWQGFFIDLHEVPADIGTSTSSTDDDGWSEERDFKVTAYVLPQAADIQAYVDEDGVRSIATDVVARCPILCCVSVNAVVQYDPKNPVDENLAVASIKSYINGLGFVGRLTRSEIVYVLKKLGAVSVDMPNKDMLYGFLYDAKGVRHALSGDALDISLIEDGSAMLSKDTVVFVAEESDIQVKMVPNS